MAGNSGRRRSDGTGSGAKKGKGRKQQAILQQQAILPGEQMMSIAENTTSQQQLSAGSSNGDAPKKSIEQLLLEAQEADEKRQQERPLTEALKGIETKSAQEMAAATKDLQTRLAEITKLVEDYKKNWPSLEGKPASILGTVQDILKRFNGIPAEDRTKIDKFIADYQTDVQTLKDRIAALDAPPPQPAPPQPAPAEPASIAEAQALVQNATVQHQAREQAYQDLVKHNKGIADKLKELETKTTKLLGDVRGKAADKVDKTDYFRAKELETDLAAIPPLLSAEELNTKLKEALTSVNTARLALLKARQKHEELGEESKHKKTLLADRQQRRADHIGRKINAMPAASPPATPTPEAPTPEAPTPTVSNPAAASNAQTASSESAGDDIPS